jgi:N-acetylglucosamine kinase-like BadF-type ATPase
MILIADSGSTKTDWRFIDAGSSIFPFLTSGFNPYFNSSADIASTLRNDLKPKLDPYLGKGLLQIYFYGAGCSNEKNCQVIRFALDEVFPDSEIVIHSDMLAAAHGLCGQSEGLVAILGTGMNSAHYDGAGIVSQQPSLGFILGDEGSGAYLGKLLLSDYLNHELPENMRLRFEARFHLSKEEILERVYKGPLPNRFLASFSLFIYQNLSQQYAVDLVAGAFRRFFDLHICKYPDSKRLKLSCSGSVAFWYSNILRGVSEEKGVVLDKVVESPIAGLSLYHLEKGITEA